MCNCVFYNGDSCSYEDYASGQTEDGYCSYGVDVLDDNDEPTGEEVGCNAYSEDEDDDEEE